MGSVPALQANPLRKRHGIHSRVSSLALACTAAAVCAWQGCRVHDVRLEPAWMVNHVTNLGLKIVVIDT